MTNFDTEQTITIPKKTGKAKVKQERVALNLSVPKEIKEWVCVHAKNSQHSLSQLMVKLIIQEQERVEREAKLKQIRDQKEIELMTDYKQIRLQQMLALELNGL